MTKHSMHAYFRYTVYTHAWFIVFGNMSSQGFIQDIVSGGGGRISFFAGMMRRAMHTALLGYAPLERFVDSSGFGRHFTTQCT